MTKQLIYLISMVMVTSMLHGQTSVPGKSDDHSVKWYSFEEGIKLAKKKHKYILVDIYTDWCGWCKKMDNETFRDPAVVKYLEEHFVAIKLNAEEKAPIAFNGNIYNNPNPARQRSTHQLAVALAGAKLSYPTYVYLDSKGKAITTTQGYTQPEDLMPLLEYIGSNAYKSKTWKDYTGLR